MSERSWPFYDGVTGGTPVYEDEWSMMARMWSPSGVHPVDDDYLRVTGGPGMKVTILPGRALVRGHCYWLTDPLDLVIPAAVAGGRRDRVVLRLDPAANRITAVLLVGAAGVMTPPAPTHTDIGVDDLVLGTVMTGAQTVTLSDLNITDERTWTGAGNYKPWSPAMAASSGGTPGITGSTGRWCRDGDRVVGNGYIRGFSNSGSGVSGDELGVTLPVPPRTTTSPIGRMVLYHETMSQVGAWELATATWGGAIVGRPLRMAQPVNSPSTQLGNVVRWTRAQLSVYIVTNAITVDYTFDYEAA